MRFTTSLLAPLALAFALTPEAGAATVTLQDPEAKPILKPADRDALAGLFGEYFKHRSENSDLKKLSGALTKLEDDLKKKAKAAKLTTLLDSPIDLRSAMCAPFLDNKNMKKGFFAEDKTSVELAAGTADVAFLYRLPKNYSSKQLYPVVIALPPKLDKLESIKKWAEAAYPEAVAELAIVLVPINTKGTDWTSLEGMMTALFPLRQAQNTYSIDRGRIFLDGQADAAAVVVNYVVQYPSLFTGAVLRDSSAAPAIEMLANARYVPFLLVAGADGAAAKVHSQFAQDCSAAGVKTQSSTSPVEASGKLGDAGAADYAKFLADTRKTFAPRDLKFSTASTQNVNAYWLEISKLETGAGKAVSVEASIDRTSNEIRITAPPQVKELVIYLNQDVIDMGKEFKVIVTEKTADNPKTATGFQGKKENSLDLALALWFENRSANSGEVYSNFVKVKMP